MPTPDQSSRPFVAHLSACLVIVLAATLAGGAGLAAAKDGPKGLVASDTGAEVSPLPFWGKIDCQADTRQQLIASGGDPNLAQPGVVQGNQSFRRMTVLDGDDYWGERCELGWNNHKSPVAFYKEGRRRITYASIRLPSNYPLNSPNWQGVLQMKQAGPADNSSGPPVLSLSAFAGTWQLWHSPPGYTMKEDLLWAATARTGVWTRFAFDIKYSRKKKKGRVTVYADLNGDLDLTDPGERSPRFRTNTLKREIAGTNGDGHKRGESLRSHLRAGINHDTVIPCPAPNGCSVDVDNIQVVAP